MSQSSPKKDEPKRIAALGDAEPEDVFRKMFREADKKIRPELRQRPKHQGRGKRNAQEDKSA